MMASLIFRAPCSDQTHTYWWWLFEAQCETGYGTKLMRAVSCHLCWNYVSRELLDEPEWMKGKWFSTPAYYPLRLEKTP